MADKIEKKVAENATAPNELVPYRIERDLEGNNDDVFCSLNFKNYIIKRGVTVMIPKALADMLDDNKRAAEKAFEYREKMKYKDQ